MNEKINPWDMVYELYKDTYTKEEVDEMLMCELTELIQKYYAQKNNIYSRRSSGNIMVYILYSVYY